MKSTPCGREVFESAEFHALADRWLGLDPAAEADGLVDFELRLAVGEVPTFTLTKRGQPRRLNDGTEESDAAKGGGES